MSCNIGLTFKLSFSKFLNKGVCYVCYVMFDDYKRGSTVLATTNFRGCQRGRERGGGGGGGGGSRHAHADFCIKSRITENFFTNHVSRKKTSEHLQFHFIF